MSRRLVIRCLQQPFQIPMRSLPFKLNIQAISLQISSFLGGFIAMQHNQVYHTPSASSSSNYTTFSGQGGAVDMREAIERELEKEMIREKIIAEEVERKCVLEAEVRRELTIGREMIAMQTGSRGLLGPQPGGSKEIATPLSKNPGNPYMLTLLGGKMKPPPPPSLLPVAAGSTKLNAYGLKNKNKMQWTCPICEVSVTCQRGFEDHLAGKKHQAKAAALRAEITGKTMESVDRETLPLVMKNSFECVSNDSKEDKKPSPPLLLGGSTELNTKKLEWRCPMCKICARTERDLVNHLAGKKHQAKAASIRKGKEHMNNIYKNLEAKLLQAVIGADPDLTYI